MDVYNRTLHNLFDETKQYVVPLFQRPYSWKKRNWEELWRDLLNIYELKDMRNHFMGAIVTMPVKMDPGGLNKFLLIDGQQRLTTMFVILACIRDLAGNEDDQYNEINFSYLVNQFKKGSNRNKLLPTQADRKAFNGILHGTRHPDSILSRAYDFFSEALSYTDDDTDPIDLLAFKDAIMEHLHFVSIVLDHNDDPYRIFHSLNATGAPLTQADLVRNHVFMNIPETDQDDAYSELWLPMQEAYPGNQLRDYIWRFVNLDGVPIRQNGVYDAIRRRVAKLVEEKGSADHLLIDLKITSDYYDRILDPSKETNRFIRPKLLRLNRWELTTVYPLLLNLYIALNDHRITGQTFCAVLEVVESYVVRRHICSVPIRQLTNYFIRMFNEVSGQPDFVQAVSEYLLDRNFPTDEVFLDNWVRHPLYGDGSRRDKCRMILESLESFETNNNEPVDTAFPNISIEHVMPQTLTPEWYDELGENAGADHAQYLHTVGNLTLTGQNESMGNKDYAYKSEVFAQSNFTLNKYFVGCDSWNAESIVRRAEQLGELAVKIWPRPRT